MIRATFLRRASETHGNRVIDRVVLDADERQRRRVVLTGEKGTTFLLDLPQSTMLRDGGDRLRIRRDHVLEEMLVGLGARLTAVEAPFEPERGAYHHHHEHDHGS